MMGRKILWESESGVCSSCGCARKSTRSYTSGDSRHVFCRPCWDDLIIECSVERKEWVGEVGREWDSDIVFVLIPERQLDGASPDSGNWS